MKIDNSENFFNAVRKINEVVFDESASDFYSHVLDSSLNEVKLSLSNAKNSSFNGVMEKLKALTGRQMFEIMMNDVMCDDKPHFMVITHGDLWINNIMFRYDKNDQVDDVKFVDLQTIRYGNMVRRYQTFVLKSKINISLFTGLRSLNLPLFKHKGPLKTSITRRITGNLQNIPNKEHTKSFVKENRHWPR